MGIMLGPVGLSTDSEPSTDLLTARGWVNLADVRVGDHVFHPDGHATRVEFVSDVVAGRGCYRVTTTDGRSIVADADACWTVQDRLAERSKGPRGGRVRSYHWRALTTEQLLSEGLLRQHGRRVVTNGVAYTSREFRFRLPAQQLVKSAAVEGLPIDPYMLGVWLGDGASASAQITVGREDVEETTRLVEDVGYGLVSAHLRKTAWSLRPVGLQKQ